MLDRGSKGCMTATIQLAYSSVWVFTEVNRKPLRPALVDNNFPSLQLTAASKCYQWLQGCI